MSQKPPADREELAISQARPYTAPGVRVFYDRGRCLHFAECVRGLPQVFDVEKRPWIQPENAPAEEVAEVGRWIWIKSEWDLSVNPNEKTALNDMLATCKAD